MTTSRIIGVAVDVLNPDLSNKKIVILGGGTAGWMAANLLQHHLADHGYGITLLESPDIGIVGVGEGSTPHLKNFFHTLGIAESDWMPACHATFKNGISFKGWSSQAGYEQYFHPFPCAADKQTAISFLLNCMAKRHGHEVDAHPNHYFLSAYLAAQGLSPKNRGQQKLSINYAYHFDSVLLGQYLAKLAVNKGVKHIQGRCDAVLNHPNGEIKCLVQHTIESFVSAFIAGGLSQQHQAQFNQRINARFDGIRDYIVCHYKVNSCQDSEYWLANQHNASISDSLKHILECWDKGADITAEINRQQIAEYYPALSWHCLLAGYGRFESSTASNALPQSVKQQAEFAKIQRFIQRCAEEFLPHQQALLR